MGKGDKRSKKGKIIIGSYGVSRPRPTALAKRKATAIAASGVAAKPKKVKTVKAVTAKVKTDKPAKAPAKKPSKKKAEE